jgi:hypothetical protein
MYRLYFTSESHLQTLVNVLRFAGQGEQVSRSSTSSSGRRSQAAVVVRVEVAAEEGEEGVCVCGGSRAFAV